MTPDPTDWHGVAEAKLASILGRDRGQVVMAETLEAVGRPSLATAADLLRFAQVLTAKGGFAAAIGGLLRLHAVMYSPEPLDDA